MLEEIFNKFTIEYNKTHPGPARGSWGPSKNSSGAFFVVEKLKFNLLCHSFHYFNFRIDMIKAYVC